MGPSRPAPVSALTGHQFIAQRIQLLARRILRRAFVGRRVARASRGLSIVEGGSALATILGLRLLILIRGLGRALERPLVGGLVRIGPVSRGGGVRAAPQTHGGGDGEQGELLHDGGSLRGGGCSPYELGINPRQCK